ncbi:MAG: sulfurtransferase FdhD [Rhodomicrobium sp.]|nr:MAG: sulfurtransferase FdhD [Rhodomicrobium sp.]
MTFKNIAPTPENTNLYRELEARDHNGDKITAAIIHERPLTIFLNSREIVTLMTIGDHPDLLAVGYLFNQNMLNSATDITAIDYDEDLETIVVRTKVETDFEHKLKRKIQTSGCGQGTIFGDLMETIEDRKLAATHTIKTSSLYPLLKIINQTPRLYLKTGAIHGCVLCKGEEPLVYMEDVGRHNAVDKIAGFMQLYNLSPNDKCFYTTGRLTSEMVIKTVKMGIPILISRSGFTAWAVELAQKANLTLIGRARGKRFVALSGFERIIYDQTIETKNKTKRKPTAHKTEPVH